MPGSVDPARQPRSSEVGYRSRLRASPFPKSRRLRTRARFAPRSSRRGGGRGGPPPGGGGGEPPRNPRGGGGGGRPPPGGEGGPGRGGGGPRRKQDTPTRPAP